VVIAVQSIVQKIGSMILSNNEIDAMAGLIAKTIQ
jgi:hypothetical protein